MLSGETKSLDVPQKTCALGHIRPLPNIAEQPDPQTIDDLHRLDCTNIDTRSQNIEFGSHSFRLLQDNLMENDLKMLSKKCGFTTGIGLRRRGLINEKHFRSEDNTLVSTTTHE